MQYTSENVVSVKVTDVNGCTATAELRIDVDEEEVYIPNVFNPASAIAVNTTFGIRDAPGVEMVRYFRIFDRWGGLVYAAEDQTIGFDLLLWDGTHKGQLLQPAVFVYTISYIKGGGDEVVSSGDVTVIR